MRAASVGATRSDYYHRHIREAKQYRPSLKRKTAGDGPVSQPSKPGAGRSFVFSPRLPLRVVMNGDRLDIQASVDLAGLKKLKDMLTKYESILEMMQPEAKDNVFNERGRQLRRPLFVDLSKVDHATIAEWGHIRLMVSKSKKLTRRVCVPAYGRQYVRCA